MAEYNRTGDLTKYGTPAIGVQEHLYDALSRQLELRVNGVTERYRYDAAGERLIRKIPTEVANPQVYGSRFYTLQPACRLVDTRTTYGPILQGQVERTFVAFGNCGIPSNASSLAANVAAVDPTANGFLRIYPPGLSERPQTAATATRAGLTRATQSMIALSSQGKFSLFPNLPAGATSHLVVDLAGYFVKNAPPPPGPTRRETHFVTLRDENNRLLTDYRAEYDIDIATGVGTLRPDGHPYVEKDYVYLGGQLVATFSQINGWRFLVNDHLGSPRRVLDGLRNVVGTYKYRPFGTPLSPTSPTQGNDFCGMEKDAMSGDHYVHARYLTSWTGRFGGLDRVLGSATDPQSWNRYSYAKGNPLRLVDRDGRQAVPSVEEAIEAFKRLYRQLMSGFGGDGMPVVWKDGRISAGAPRLDKTLDTAIKVATVGAVVAAAVKTNDKGAPVEKDPKRRFSAQDRRDALEKAKDAAGVPRCEYCGGELDPKAGSGNSYEADHREAHSTGGPTTPENLAPFCRDCNRAKADKTIEEWRTPEDK